MPALSPFSTLTFVSWALSAFRGQAATKAGSSHIRHLAPVLSVGQTTLSVIDA